jgi:hypothetical protein
MHCLFCDRSFGGRPIVAALAPDAYSSGGLCSYLKYRHHSNLAWKGTLRQVFYLSEASFPSCDPYSPPTPVSVYTCILYTNSHREGGGGGGGGDNKR